MYSNAEFFSKDCFETYQSKYKLILNTADLQLAHDIYLTLIKI